MSRNPFGVEGLSGSRISICGLLCRFGFGLLDLLCAALALLGEVRSDPHGVRGVQHAAEACQDNEVKEYAKITVSTIAAGKSPDSCG